MDAGRAPLLEVRATVRMTVAPGAPDTPERERAGVCATAGAREPLKKIALHTAARITLVPFIICDCRHLASLTKLGVPCLMNSLSASCVKRSPVFHPQKERKTALRNGTANLKGRRGRMERYFLV